MSTFSKTLIAAIATFTLLASTTSAAAAGRYQAEWNGKSYLIIDTANGNLWTFQGDSMIYNGRIDGDEFEPPELPQIWQQSHGKWTLRK